MGMPPPLIDIFQTHYELIVGPNRQVTFSKPSEARAESAVAINPQNPSNMIAASKRFYDRANYKSSIGVSFTKNGGTSWTEVPLPATPGHPEFTWLVDPDVAFDGKGNAYLWAEPVDKPPGLETIAMVAYRSTDGGASYVEKAILHNDNSDERGFLKPNSQEPRKPKPSRHCERSEAIQGTKGAGRSWIAASLRSLNRAPFLKDGWAESSLLRQALQGAPSHPSDRQCRSLR
jgi:hypothetical protein